MIFERLKTLQQNAKTLFAAWEYTQEDRLPSVGERADYLNQQMFVQFGAKTNYNTNMVGRWRRNDPSAPAAVQCIMRRDILVWLCGKRAGTALANLLEPQPWQKESKVK